MNINGTTLFLFLLSLRVSAGPQKPQTLTASKTKYEKFGPKFGPKFNYSLKDRYFSDLIFLEREFFDS
jgi:hypothetical protein